MHLWRKPGHYAAYHQTLVQQQTADYQCSAVIEHGDTETVAVAKKSHYQGLIQSDIIINQTFSIKCYHWISHFNLYNQSNSFYKFKQNDFTFYFYDRGSPDTKPESYQFPWKWPQSTCLVWNAIWRNIRVTWQYSRSWRKRAGSPLYSCPAA